ANRTAEALARIERDRRQGELAPQFEIALAGEQGDHATLDVQLRGPAALSRLDEIVIEVTPSDDRDRTLRLPHPGMTQEQIDAHTWGPYRFRPGIDEADAHGQRIAAFPLVVGRGRPIAVERTRPPAWQEGANRDQRWRDQWDGKPIKLRIHCRRGDLVWELPYDLPIPPTPRIRVM
ncbi:unnamed protein product, partial [marine sediment metagenome]